MYFNPSLIYIYIYFFTKKINSYFFFYSFGPGWWSWLTSLTLVCCNGVTDVSALGGVHTLTLKICDGVTDVSALGGVHTLTLLV